jgi:hypothetical protein
VIKLIIVVLILLPVTAVALVNGRPLEGAPDIVRLRYSKTSVCSGVYIDPYTILTAAHCTKQSESFKPVIQQIETVGDEPLNVKVVKLISHPDYAGQFWPASDIGLVKTTANPKFEGAFVLSSSPSPLTGGAYLYGTGRKQSKVDEFFRTLGQNRFFKFGSVLVFFGPSRGPLVETGEPATIAHGDSGGTITDASTGRIIAVITTSTIDESASWGIPSLCTATSVLTISNHTFILKNLGP